MLYYDYYRSVGVLIFDLQLWFGYSSRCRTYVSIKFNSYSTYQPNNPSYLCYELCKRQNNLLYSWQFPVTSGHHLRKLFDLMWSRYSNQKLLHEKSSHPTLISKRGTVPLVTIHNIIIRKSFSTRLT